MPVEWWDEYDNIIALTAWMAENGFAAREIAAAVEYPWRYGDEFQSSQEDEE